MVVGYIKYKKANINSVIFKSAEVEVFNENYVIGIYKNAKGNRLNNFIEKRKIKKIIKIIKMYKIDTIVFAKDVEQEFQVNVLAGLENLNYSINTLNGKRIMKYIDYEIMSYIFENQNKKMQEEDIYILFKQDKTESLHFKSNMENIKKYISKYIKNFKTVNLITNDIRELRILQEELQEKEGMLIGVSNNKRKALKRAKYILNINLGKNDLEKYNINRNAIIVNLEENIIYSKPDFEGINVNYVSLEIPDEYQETFEAIGDKFDTTTLYASLVFEYSRRMKMKAIERIRDDKIKIRYLIGNNGKISTEELKQMAKRRI